MLRNIPPVTKSLLLINIVVFFASFWMQRLADGMGFTRDFNDLLGLHFFLAPNFGIYQLFTYMFVHAGWQHLFFNMFALWMFGGVVETTFGRNRFLFYYFVCGIGAGLFQEAAQFAQFYLMANEHIAGFTLSQLPQAVQAFGPALNLWTTVGASGAVYGILLAFGMLFPEQRIFIFPIPVPIKAKWFVMIYAAIEVYSAMADSGDGVAHLAHLGGMVFGFMLIRYWRRNPHSAQKVDEVMNLFGNIGRHMQQNRSQRTYTPPRNDVETEQREAERRAKEQAEVDAILDKIRRNGYDSLTRAEKQRLFDQHNRA